MEKSIYDLVVDELNSRQRDVREELRKRFKKTKPFRMVKVSDKERLDEYLRMTPQDMQMAIQQQGEESVNNYIGEMEELKNRRMYNG